MMNSARSIDNLWLFNKLIDVDLSIFNSRLSYNCLRRGSSSEIQSIANNICSITSGGLYSRLRIRLLKRAPLSLLIVLALILKALLILILEALLAIIVVIIIVKRASLIEGIILVILERILWLVPARRREVILIVLRRLRLVGERLEALGTTQILASLRLVSS